MKKRMGEFMGTSVRAFPDGVSNATLFVPQQKIEQNDQSIFASFWMGGYEGADHLNGSDGVVSMCDITQHHLHAAADYARLADFGIRTVRESAGWRIVDQPDGFEFASLESRARAAQAEGLQVVWTLCHYGWPDGLDVFSADFVDRFARYAGAVAGYLRGFTSACPVYAPINELSFLSWAACEASRTQFDSRLCNRSQELRRQLVRAAIAACDAIWEVDPRARILHTDPLVHIAAPAGRPQLAPEAARQCELQFQGWDMLRGTVEPELGGHPRYLDLVGVNYYQGNQWELVTARTLNWRLDDPRRVSLATLLDKVHRRYARPIIIAETGHLGVGRSAWLRDVAEDVHAACRQGVPVQGICLYPIIDRPDWDNTDQWHSSGLWDLEPLGNGELRRNLDQDFAAALHELQRNRPGLPSQRFHRPPMRQREQSRI
jgi:beta-glucosidase/6-phospho-beta-glucosidase/beta-galactosidase